MAGLCQLFAATGHAIWPKSEAIMPPKLQHPVGHDLQTRFASKPDAVETIVLARENGSWRVSGYFIR